MRIVSILFAVVSISAIHCFTKHTPDRCVSVEGFLGSCKKLRHCVSFRAPHRTYQYSLICRRHKVCCLDYPNVHITSMVNEPESKERPVKTDITTMRPTFVEDRSSDQQIPNLRVRGCGIREINMTDFIVGGQESNYWPWMATVFYRPRDATRPRFQCGGTVIARRYILTAAHCLQEGGVNIVPNRLIVRMGGLNQSGDGQIYRVVNITIHEQYRSNLRYYDIAILKLSRGIESKSVVPICLPSPGMYSANFFQRNATIVGWGRTSEGGTFSNNLREVVIPIVPNRKCDTQYKTLNSLSLPRGIIDSHICAGTEDGTKDACQGDSGGPLIIQDRSLRWSIIGIVSFGYGCAHPDFPGVYSRVARYLSWIRDNTDIPARYS